MIPLLQTAGCQREYNDIFIGPCIEYDCECVCVCMRLHCVYVRLAKESASELVGK